MVWRFQKEIIAVLLLWLSFSILKTQEGSSRELPPLPFALVDYQQSFAREVILENTRLRNLVGWPEIQSLQVAGPGKVVALDPVGAPCWLTVEAGELQETLPALTVLDRNGNLVGQVVKKKNGRLTVMTILNPESRVSVSLQESRNLGILRSVEIPPATLLVNYIPSESPVQPGELAVTSPISTAYPPGIPVGTLHRATAGQGFFQEVTLKPRVNFATLEEVFLVY